MVHKADGQKRTEAGETHRALLDEGARRLAAAGVDDARREAEWLLADTLGEERALLYARPERPVPPEQAQRVRARLRRRAEGEPLQYVLGHADFFGLRLAVSPAVLIPRPETETLVQEALHVLAEGRRPRLLDVGTGSGCIALALASERPDADVHACDVSAGALAVARANADACGCSGVRFYRADVLAEPFPRKGPADLDLLISNPPYVPDAEAEALPASVREHEPPTALFTGDDPLRFYRALAHRAPRMLASGGRLLLEAHAPYAGAVAALLRERGLANVTVTEDAFGRERIVGAANGGGRRP
jgi:release factor glutamine methyltransferase